MKQLLLLLSVGFLGYSIGNGSLTYNKFKKIAYVTSNHVEKAYIDISNQITK